MRHACVVHRAVDGDTVEVTIDLGFGVDLRRFVRLSGIETAELQGGDRLRGQAARSELASIVAAADWWVMVSSGTDRWGRIVADLVHPRDGWSVAGVMVASGHAWEVEGRSRRCGWAGTRGRLAEPGV